MKGNDALIFDPGNQFSDDLAAPYTVIPSSWRNFLFHVLKPREVSVYLYLCSLCDKNSIAYPSILQIQQDIGITSTTTVTAAIKALEDRGFFLRKRAVLPRRNSGAHQNVYQRPSMHYTLLRLLEARQVDGNLYPINKVRDTPRRESKAVHMALKKILGAGYHRYEMLSGEQERSDYLKTQLAGLLEKKRMAAAMSFTIFQGGLAISTVSRLKRAEDQLLYALNSLARREAHRVPRIDAALILLPTILRNQRDRLRQAVESKNVAAIESWLDSFKRDASRLESEMLSELSDQPSSAGASKEVAAFFETYRLAPVRLSEVLSQRDNKDVPF